MFEKLAYPNSKRLPRLLVAGLWALCLIIFATMQDRIGPGIAALAIFPITAAGWYFGAVAGLAMAGLTLLALLLGWTLSGHSPLEAWNVGVGLASLDLLLVGWMAGRWGEAARRRPGERRRTPHPVPSNGLAADLSRLAADMEKAGSAGEIIQVLVDELRELNINCLPAFYFRANGRLIFQYGSLLSAGSQDSAGRLRGQPLSYELQVEQLEPRFGIENVLSVTLLPEPLKAIRTILAGLPLWDAGQTLHGLSLKDDTPVVHLPLLVVDHLLGILWLWGPALSGTDLPLLSLFASQIAISLEKARLSQEVQNLALTDPLTGLYNRRGLLELGRIEFIRTLRAGRPFSGIMVDLDHFRKINDSHGRFVGDRILLSFAERCRKSVREVDLVGRYGGEEIIILLPETDLEESIVVAERVRRTLSDPPIQIAADLSVRVTASLGVARQDENTPNLETLIARADQAMYVAKHRGRNRVATST